MRKQKYFCYALKPNRKTIAVKKETVFMKQLGKTVSLPIFA